MKRKTHALVDGDLIVYRMASACEREIDWGNDIWTLGSDLHEASVMIEEEIKRVVAKVKATSLTVCFSDRADNFRKYVDPGYKGGRKKTRKPMGYSKLVSQVLSKYPCACWPSLEADDVLGILASRTKASVVVSWDKDMGQIPGRHYNPITNTFSVVTPAGGNSYFLTQVLTGDKVDGYAGCPGIGPVRAAAILEQDPTWSAVERAYAVAGLTKHEAIKQARLAYILKTDQDYDTALGRVNLWNPPTL